MRMPTRRSRALPRSNSSGPSPMRLLIVALAALASLLHPQAAAAEERILRFDSNIAVGRDGTLDVTETIHVRVENIAINHGIFRDLPDQIPGNRRPPGQGRVRAGRYLLDGQAEPNKVETLTNGIRIRIGSADRTVPPGEHIYMIRYRASRMIGRFDGYDELYWNATGNGWDFPIDRPRRLSRCLRPPVSASAPSIRDLKAQPSRLPGSPARTSGSIRFETTRPALFARGADVRRGVSQGCG